MQKWEAGKRGNYEAHSNIVTIILSDLENDTIEQKSRNIGLKFSTYMRDAALKNKKKLDLMGILCKRDGGRKILKNLRISDSQKKIIANKALKNKLKFSVYIRQAALVCENL